MAVCAIEIDGPVCENLFFLPIAESVRGRLDWTKLKDEKAPRGDPAIPSQRIELDAEKGIGRIVETLHEDEHEALRERLARRYRIPKTRTFESCDVASWAHWMAKAVNQGIAKVVSGKLPQVEGKPVVSLIFTERKEPTVNERIASALEQLLETVKAKK